MVKDFFNALLHMVCIILNIFRSIFIRNSGCIFSSVCVSLGLVILAWYKISLDEFLSIQFLGGQLEKDMH